ncbi:MAG: RHS repeat-associated core domain-containing protein [Acidimicrobiales bacterium]
MTLTQAGVTTAYLSDAFGSRVRESSPAGHTVFIDRWAEHNGTTHTQHLYIGDRRFATNAGTALNYFVADHLGSTIASTFTFFNDIKFRRYVPFGQTRGTDTVPSQHGYTGQRRDTTSLMSYQSRYYDPLVGRFTQADTIVPDAATPAAFNRYSYVINNPLKYVDPTGHCYGLPADAADACVGVFNDSPLAGGYHLETWGAAGELGCGHVICETSATQQGTPGGSVGVTIDTFIAQADGSRRVGHLRAVFNIDRLNPMGGTFGAGVTRRSQSPWSDTLNWTTSAAGLCAMGAGLFALASGGAGGGTYALCGGAAAAGGVAQVGVGAARGDRSQVVTGGFNAAGGGLGALGGDGCSRGWRC